MPRRQFLHIPLWISRPVSLRQRSRYLSNVRYPAYWDMDAFFAKTTKISERMSATFRMEALNALNGVVFGGPDAGVSDTNFGYNPQSQINNPRWVQISGRFTF